VAFAYNISVAILPPTAISYFVLKNQGNGKN
jgi:hypothetical protein